MQVSFIVSSDKETPMDIAGYKIDRKIGEGAMATVFLADQLSLGRQVALKILSPALACQRDFTVRFLNEGRIIAHLNHPQIVSVYDLGANDHHYYLAMEFLSGGTLEQRIKSGMSTAQALQLITTICRSLSFAHMHGVIHRDIKPQNILFRNDTTPVLTDFGIARLMNSDPGLTIPGRTVGSPLYMSPEQICGRKIDERSDLYAVGILFYEMLTNQLPYQSDEFVDIALMHKTAPIPVLPDDRSVFQPIMDKLLAKKPEDRYGSAQVLIDALEQIDSQNTFPAPDTDGRLDLVGHRVRKLDGGKLHLIHKQDNLADDTTQPSIEPLVGGSDDERMITSEGNQASQSDQPTLEMKHGAPFQKKSKIAWTKRWVAAAAVAAVAGGIYFYYSFETPTQEFAKSSPPGHAQASSNLGIYRSHGKDESNKQRLLIPTPDDEPALPTDPIGDRQKVEPKIASLLAKAEKQLANHRLSAPAGDNCYETYQQILSLDPSNQAAELLLMKIGRAYHRLAKANQAQGQLQKSFANVGKGLTLLPEDKALLALQAELKAELARQTERLQQQAQQIEAQKRAQATVRAAMKRKQQTETEVTIHGVEDVKNERQINQSVGLETEETSEAKIKVENPEKTKKNTVRRNRLFGTF
jgi:serine/threonine protein kinase